MLLSSCGRGSCCCQTLQIQQQLTCLNARGWIQRAGRGYRGYGHDFFAAVALDWAGEVRLSAIFEGLLLSELFDGRTGVAVVVFRSQQKRSQDSCEKREIGAFLFSPDEFVALWRQSARHPESAQQTAPRIKPQIPSDANVRADFERYTLNFFTRVFDCFLFFFFRRIFGFYIFCDIWVLRDPTISAKRKKEKNTFVNGSPGAHKTCVQNCKVRNGVG